MLLVTLTFDLTQRAEIARLTPAEQARIGTLIAEGTISARYIGADFTRVWLVFAGNDAAAIAAILAGLPLFPFVTHHEIIPLAALP